MHRFAAALLTFVFLAAVSSVQQMERKEPEGTAMLECWFKVEPGKFGVDEKKLVEFDVDLAMGKYSLVDSFRLIRCGAEVYDCKYSNDYAKIYRKEAAERGPLNPHVTGWYNYFDPAWHPYIQGTDLHSMQSVTKSVTSTIIGIAVTKGDFK